MIRIFRRAVLLGALSLLIAGCGGGGALAPQMPNLSVGSVALQSFSLTQANVLVGVDARNPNAFAVPLTGLSVDLQVAGVTIGRGTLPQAMTLPAGGAVRVPVIVSANPLQLGVQAPALMQQPTLPYRITGTANIGGFRIPIPIAKTGVLRLR